jgi:DNA-binding winged helix-turn-helix (wHTH) protein
LAHLSFGPFRLVLTQFLVLEGDKPVPLGSRALEILIALLERRGELVIKKEFGSME